MWYFSSRRPTMSTRVNTYHFGFSLVLSWNNTFFMWTFPVFLSSGSGLVKYPVDYQMAWYYHTDLYCNTVVLFFLLVKGNGFHREISRNSLYSWMLRRPVIVEVLNAKRQGGVPLTICTTFHLWIQSLQILHLKSLQKHDHLVQLRYIFFCEFSGETFFF